jgi:lysophospholipase
VKFPFSHLWRKAPDYPAGPEVPAELRSFDMNPAPPGMKARYLFTRDGRRIRFALARTATQPFKGTIIILTGRNECIEKYHETSADLMQNGFDVLTFDWRGQGESAALLGDPHKGHVHRYTDYRYDVEAVFTHVALPDCRAPFFVLAHSMGGLVALDAAPILKGKVERMVLLTPFFGIMRQPLSTRGAGALARLLTLCGLGSLYLGGGPRKAAPFHENKVTSDPERYARNIGLYEAHPQLGRGAPTARWVAEAVSTMRRLRDRAERPEYRIPCLILIAGKDRVVPRDAIEDMARNLPAAHSRVIEGAEHELLQERDYIREQALVAITSFLPGTGQASKRVGMPTAQDA